MCVCACACACACVLAVIRYEGLFVEEQNIMEECIFIIIHGNLEDAFSTSERFVVKASTDHPAAPLSAQSHVLVMLL